VLAPGGVQEWSIAEFSIGNGRGTECNADCSLRVDGAGPDPIYSRRSPKALKDVDYARIAQDSIEELGRSHHCRIEGRSAAFEVGGRKYRIVQGKAEDSNREPEESLLVLSWEDQPSVFASYPDPAVTLFDLRFGAHSRHLDEFAAELRDSLFVHGIHFREMDSGPAKGPVRFSLRGIVKRLSRRGGA